MIRATIELFPYGNETRRHELGKLDIANIGDGNYKAKLMLRDKIGELPREYYSKIFAFDRKRSVAYLLELALKEVLKEYDLPDWEEEIK